MSRALPCALLCALPCVLVACGGTSTQSGPCVPGQDTSWVQGDAFGTLSQYCMVSLVNGDIVPKDGVVPYDLNTPLFSDRAVKKRTIFVPKGASITYDAALAFDLPTGSIVTKSFGFRDDLRKANPIVTWVETRVMLRRADGWHGQSYVWNAEQTEAVYTPGGAVRALSWIDENGDAEGTTSYLVPSSTQCRQCHVLSNVTTLIGPKARNLNRDFAYSTGTENQLAHWTSLGLLTGAPAPSAAPKLAVWNDPSTGTVDARARAYLETNCAHCHNAGGEARTTGLFLLTSETDPAVYGVCKQPVAAGPGSGGHTYDIVPGDPDNSILPFRMTSTQAGILMPQIGRSVEDKAGVALVRDWITGIAAGTSTCH